MNHRAVLFAVASADLFGVSTPLAKALLGSTDAFALAGLLYLGVSVGVAVLRWLAPGLFSAGQAPDAALTRAEYPWLAGAIAARAGAGPLLLMVASPIPIIPMPHRHPCCSPSKGLRPH